MPISSSTTCGLEFLGDLQRLQPISGGAHLVALQIEHQGETLCAIAVIIHDQHRVGVAARGVGGSRFGRRRTARSAGTCGRFNCTTKLLPWPGPIAVDRNRPPCSSTSRLASVMPTPSPV